MTRTDRENRGAIQLTRSGTEFQGSEKDLDRLRLRFTRQQCVRLPRLLELELLRVIWEQIGKAEFHARAHEGIGVEFCMKENITLHLLHFLVNNPRLFEIIGEISGYGPIGSFEGRVYRMMTKRGHYDSWHGDMYEHRLIGMSINLSTEVYCGGIFQLRERGRGTQILSEMTNTGFGDALLFQIAPHLVHRITPLEGTVPKTAFAGWFKSEPDFRSLIRQERS